MAFEESENTNFVIPANSNNRNSVTVTDNGKLNIKIDASGSNFVIDIDSNLVMLVGIVLGKVYRPSSSKNDSSYKWLWILFNTYHK